MKQPLRVVAAAAGDVWDYLLNAVAYNLMWLCLSLLVVPAPPATLALFYVAHQIAGGRAPVYLTEYLRHVRRLFGLGWRWGALNAVALFFILGDILITSRVEQTPLVWLGHKFFIATLVAWGLIQFYALPLLFEQAEPSVRLATRNGAVMLAKNPGFSILLGLLVSLLLLASALLLIVPVVLGGVFVALVGCHAVANRLKVPAPAS